MKYNLRLLYYPIWGRWWWKVTLLKRYLKFWWLAFWLLCTRHYVFYELFNTRTVGSVRLLLTRSCPIKLKNAASCAFRCWRHPAKPSHRNECFNNIIMMIMRDHIKKFPHFGRSVMDSNGLKILKTCIWPPICTLKAENHQKCNFSFEACLLDDICPLSWTFAKLHEPKRPRLFICPKHQWIFLM